MEMQDALFGNMIPMFLSAILSIFQSFGFAWETLYPLDDEYAVFMDGDSRYPYDIIKNDIHPDIAIGCRST